MPIPSRCSHTSTSLGCSGLENGHPAGLGDTHSPPPPSVSPSVTSGSGPLRQAPGPGRLFILSSWPSARSPPSLTGRCCPQIPSRWVNSWEAPRPARPPDCNLSGLPVNLQQLLTGLSRPLQAEEPDCGQGLSLPAPGRVLSRLRSLATRLGSTLLLSQGHQPCSGYPSCPLPQAQVSPWSHGHGKLGLVHGPHRGAEDGHANLTGGCIIHLLV